MTLGEIKDAIDHIKAIAGDDEAAHGEEDQLMCDFISHVASLEIPELSEKAKLVLTTKEIDFARWRA